MFVALVCGAVLGELVRAKDFAKWKNVGSVFNQLNQNLKADQSLHSYYDKYQNI